MSIIFNNEAHLLREGAMISALKIQPSDELLDKINKEDEIKKRLGKWYRGSFIKYRNYCVAVFLCSNRAQLLQLHSIQLNKRHRNLRQYFFAKRKSTVRIPHDSAIVICSKKYKTYARSRRTLHCNCTIDYFSINPCNTPTEQPRESKQNKTYICCTMKLNYFRQKCRNCH